MELSAVLEYEDGWKIPKILKRDREEEETAENKRKQIFTAQWEAALLEQLVPQSKTIMLVE